MSFVARNVADSMPINNPTTISPMTSLHSNLRNQDRHRSEATEIHDSVTATAQNVYEVASDPVYGISGRMLTSSNSLGVQSQQ